MMFPSVGPDDDLRNAQTQAQIDGPRRAGTRLLVSAQALMSKNPARQGRRRAESAARQALAQYASAVNWAEGTSEEDVAHQQLDEAGSWTRRTFGCHLSFDGTSYSQRCSVAIAHKRFGFSVGGTARRLCSLCGDDLSECEHMHGTAYLVPGGSSPLGWCRVCGSSDGCEHLEELSYPAVVVSRIAQMDLEEVSFVNRPASPDARLSSLAIDTDELRHELGPTFVTGQPVSCDRCLDPCRGFEYLPESLLLDEDPEATTRAIP